MEVILISAKALLPLFAFMMLGFWIKKRGFLSDDATKQINILVFRFFLPIMCAETIYKANLRAHHMFFATVSMRQTDSDLPTRETFTADLRTRLRTCWKKE